MRPSTICIYVAGVMLAGTAAVHGVLTERWSPADLEKYRQDLTALPLELGDWRGEEVKTDGPPPEENTAHITRRYTNARTNSTVLISLTCGFGGTVSTHTPDVCYPGSGYSVTQAVDKKDVSYGNGTRTATFYTAGFQKTRATSVEKSTVQWAWSPDGSWQAPGYPRFAYAGTPKLFKLYVITPTPEKSSPEQERLVHDFTDRLLTAADKTYFAR